jgi:hypothetical protein
LGEKGSNMIFEFPQIKKYPHRIRQSMSSRMTCQCEDIKKKVVPMCFFASHSGTTTGTPA